MDANHNQVDTCDGEGIEIDVSDMFANDTDENSSCRTGEYDVSFFRQGLSIEPPKSGLEHLSDARVGMSLFIEEAQRALETTDLTVDQRIHVATILSFIDGLASRLDIVRRPGFMHRKRRSSEE